MLEFEYNEQLELCSNVFNNLTHELLARGYDLLFAGELQDLGNNISGNEEIVFDSELLILSKDPNVLLIGNCFHEIKYLLDQLITKTNIEVPDIQELFDQNGIPADVETECKIADYSDELLKITGGLLQRCFDIVDLLEDFIYKAAGVNGNSTIERDLIEPRIDALEPYCDSNTKIVVEMTQILHYLMSVLLKDCEKRGLLKNMSMEDLLNKGKKGNKQ